MRISVAALVALLVIVPTAARADIPPPPPPGLDKPPTLRPFSIAVAGAAAAIAVALAGVLLSRFRRVVLIPAMAIAAAILVTAGALAFRTERAWDDHAQLKAQYDKTLANWRSSWRGPIDRPPPNYRQAPVSVSILAVATQDSFPNSLPWGALILNVTSGYR